MATSSIDPSRAALLVMDYQPATVQMVAEPEALVGRVAEAIRVARGAGIQIGYVRVALTPEKDVHPTLAPEPGDIVVVLSTIRDAADRDKRLMVLADCCADTDPEVHPILTERVFPRQADVIESAELAGVIGPSDRD